jgi:ribosomal protein S27E
MGVLHMKQDYNSSKNAVSKNLAASRAQIIAGYIIAVFCGLTAVIGCVNTSLATTFDITMVAIFLVFTACGIWQIVRGKKRKKLIVLFRDYAVRLAADPQRSINKLAAATGAAAGTVKRNILLMIHKGFFANAFIDFDKNCLIFPQERNEQKSDLLKQGESVVEYVRVSCPGCGAKNKIQKGTVGECEFCGSYLAQG